MQGLLQEDTISATDTKLIDNAWRGAEAFHFWLLAQRQLYKGNREAAMVTALQLRQYEDLLNPVDIYSLLALTCSVNRAFGTCSKAFIKLQSLSELTQDQQEEYEALALDIFTRHSPKDRSVGESGLPGWDMGGEIEEGETRLPVCIVTGRPIIDYQFWMCGTCKHRAYEGEIDSYNYCPLCHSSM